MKRASFLKNIAAIGLGGIIPYRARALQKRQQKLYLLQCFVAGFQYYEGAAVLNDIQVGDTLSLKREYNNHADKKAMALYYKNAKIGFVPRRYNHTISKLMDTGIAALKVDVTHIRKDVGDWEKLYVAVYTMRSLNEPLPKESEYLTKLKAPKYTSTPQYKSPEKIVDWYAMLVAQSKTDHIYSLIHEGLSGDLEINHPYDFVVVDPRRLPAAKDLPLATDCSKDFLYQDISFQNRHLMAVKNNRLTNYLEAARHMRRVTDKNYRNFIQLIF